MWPLRGAVLAHRRHAGPAAHAAQRLARAQASGQVFGLALGDAAHGGNAAAGEVVFGEQGRVETRTDQLRACERARERVVVVEGAAAGGVVGVHGRDCAAPRTVQSSAVYISLQAVNKAKRTLRPGFARLYWHSFWECR